MQLTSRLFLAGTGFTPYVEAFFGEGTANNDFLQHLDIQKNTKMSRSRSVCHPEPGRHCHPERSPFLVILNGAAGGVKDLEHRLRALHQILR